MVELQQVEPTQATWQTCFKWLVKSAKRSSRSLR